MFSLGPIARAPSDSQSRQSDGNDGEDAHDEGFDFDFDFGVFGHARGANENFCYCAYGFSSDRFPNGLGFGGQVGHHCLFLDAGFETGHYSTAAATFGKARLLAPCVSDSCGDAKQSSRRGPSECAPSSVGGGRDFQARLAAPPRGESEGAGSGARGGVRTAKHDGRARSWRREEDAGPGRAVG